MEGAVEVYTTKTKVQAYYSNYIRNARAISVLWAFHTISFFIINIIIFIQPQWIGDTYASAGIGYFGLYEYCQGSVENGGSDLECTGWFGDFDTILHPAFKASTVFVGVSCIIIAVCIIVMCLLCCNIKDTKIFFVCGILQSLSAVCILLAIVIYPAGWENARIRAFCGADASSYHLGDCRVRWAYILAIIGFFIILFLAILAFSLSLLKAEMSLPSKPRAYKTTSTLPPSSVRNLTLSSQQHQPNGRLHATLNGGGTLLRAYDSQNSMESQTMELRATSQRRRVDGSDGTLLPNGGVGPDGTLFLDREDDSGSNAFRPPMPSSVSDTGGLTSNNPRSDNAAGATTTRPMMQPMIALPDTSNLPQDPYNVQYYSLSRHAATTDHDNDDDDVIVGSGGVGEGGLLRQRRNQRPTSFTSSSGDTLTGPSGDDGEATLRATGSSGDRRRTTPVRNRDYNL